MLQASLQLYRNAYSGLSRPMWWLALVIFINRCGTMVIPFLTVYLTENKGFSLAQAGYVMAAFGTGSILGGFIGGKLTDRFGHYHVQVFSLLLNGILFIVLGEMQTFWQLTICIFVLSSLGEAFRPANSAAIAAYSTEQNRTRCYSLNRLAINLGWAIGPAIGGILASINYHLLFWADGLTCIFAATLLYFVFAPHREAAVISEVLERQERVASPYKDRIFLVGMFYIFLVGVCFFQTFSMLPLFFKTVVKLNETVIGALLAMNGIIIVLVEMVLIYKLENKRHISHYLSLGAALIGIGFLVFELMPVLEISIAGMIILTIGEMLLFPFMNDFWVKRTTPQNRGQYAAVYTMSFSAAIVLAPSLASQIATWYGFTALWVFDFILCLIGAAGFLLMKKRI